MSVATGVPTDSTVTRGLKPLAPYFIWGAVLSLAGAVLYGIALTKPASETFTAYNGDLLTAVDKGRVWMVLGGGVLIGVAALVFTIATIAAGVRLATRSSN